MGSWRCMRHAALRWDRARLPLQDGKQDRCKQRFCARLGVQAYCEGSPRVVKKLTLPGQLTLAPLEPLKPVLTLTCSRDKGVSGNSTMGCFCLQPDRPCKVSSLSQGCCLLCDRAHGWDASAAHEAGLLRAGAAQLLNTDGDRLKAQAAEHCEKTS